MITLGTQSLGIGLAIHLRDKFSARAVGITRQMNMMHRSALKVQRENLRAIQMMGAGMTVAGALLSRGFVRNYREYANFQHIVTSTAAILDLSNEKMREFSKLTLDLGKTSVFSPEQVASAGEFLSRQGFIFDQVKKTLPAVIQLGAATNKAIEGKGGAADIMASIMHQFNLGPSGVARLADVITKTTLVSSSDVEDIYEALKHFSATAMDLNLGLEGSLAMVATLSNAGLRGGMGGRSLNNMFLYLASAATKFRTTRQMEAFEAIGISIGEMVDKAGQLKPVIDLIRLFQDRLKSMPDVERVAATRALFNIRGARALGPLIRASELGLDFAAVLDEITNKSHGVAEAIASKRMTDSWGLLERLKDTIKAFRIEIGLSLKPVFDFVVKGLTKFFNIMTAIVSHPLGRPFVILAAAMGGVLLVGGLLLTTFATIRLVTVASTVSFANMGRTLALAWNAGTAAALRYATTAKGATLVNTPFGPRWRGAGGRFVKGPTGTIFMGGIRGGWLKGIGLFIKKLATTSGLLGIFGKAIRVVTGPIGWIGTILGAVMGFRNIIKLVVFGLGSFLNAIIFVGQAVWAVAKNAFTPWNISTDLNKATDRFKTAQNTMMEQFGVKNLDKSPLQGLRPPDRSTIGLDERMKVLDSLNQVSSGKKNITLNLDGKKVGEITDEERTKELRTLFAPIPNN